MVQKNDFLKSGLASDLLLDFIQNFVSLASVNFAVVY